MNRCGIARFSRRWSRLQSVACAILWTTLAGSARAQSSFFPQPELPTLPRDCGGCPIPIERAMREYQGRHEFITGEQVEWPDAECDERDQGGTKEAPPYPPDGFYGDAMCDPRKAAALVQGLHDVMWSDTIYGRFRHEDDGWLEGQAGVPNWTVDKETLFGGIAGPYEVTPANYCKTLDDLWSIIQQLHWVEGGQTSGNSNWPGGKGVLQHDGTGIGCLVTTGGKAGWHYADAGHPGTCYETAGQGLGDWAGMVADCINQQQGNPTTNLLEFEYIEAKLWWPNGCPDPDTGEWTWCLWETLGTGSTLGSSTFSSGSQRARGHTFLRLAPQSDGESNRPPGATDGRYFHYGSFDAPAMWERAVHGDPYGYTVNPQTTPPEPVGIGNMGWRVADRMVVVLEPFYERRADEVARSGGCTTCEPGRVDATLDGVHVRIGLGSWRNGDAGYLLIRNDTLVGSGTEILTGPNTPGSGASELGKPDGVVARLASDDSGEGFRIITHPNSTVLDQVGFPQGVAMLTPSAGGQYTIELYDDAAASWSPTQGRYIVNAGGAPFRIITVTHSMESEPNEGTPADDDYLVTGRLLIEEAVAAGAPPERTTEYRERVEATDWSVVVDDLDNREGGTLETPGDPMPIAQGFLPGSRTDGWISGHAVWELATGFDAQGVPQRREVIDRNETANGLTETLTLLDGTGATVYREVREFEPSDLSKVLELESLTVFPDGVTPHVTTVQRNPAATKFFADIAEITDAHGRWERYEYDTKGRVVKIVSQFKDRSFSEEQNRVVEFRYHENIDLLDDGDKPEFIVEKIERLEGQELARTYMVYWVPGSTLVVDPPGGVTLTTALYHETTVVRCRTLGDPAGGVQAFLNGVLQDPVASDHLVTHTREVNAPTEPSLHGHTDMVLAEDGTVTRYERYEGSLQQFGFPGETGVATMVHRGPRSAASPTNPVEAYLGSADVEPWDGTRTLRVLGPGRVQLLSQTWDMQGTFELGLWQEPTGGGADIKLSQARVTERNDAFGRATRTEYLDGTFTTTSYACCGVNVETDREGVQTLYLYDEFRRIKEIVRAPGTAAELSTVYTYDAEGRVLSTARRGADSSLIVQSTSEYDQAGRLVSTADAMGRTTTFAETIDTMTGRITRTTTMPDPDGAGPLDPATEVTLHYPDGQVLEVSGTGVAPVRFDYGVEIDNTLGAAVAWTKRIAVGEGGSETEWVKTYTDMLGRQYRTVYADGAEARSEYDARGRLAKQIDADGLITLHAEGHGPGDAPAGGPSGGWDGAWQLTAVDMDQDSQIDFAGTDRITRTEREVLRTGDHGPTAEVIRSTTSVWTTDGNASAVVRTQVQDTRTNGLESWSRLLPDVLASPVVETRTLTEYPGSQTRRVTTTHADGTSEVAEWQLGRQTSVTSRFADAGQTIRSQKTYEYDAHGRIWKEVDTRGTSATTDDRATRFTYYDDDRPWTVTTPEPAAGQNAQTTTSHYDGAGRLIRTDLPDTGQVHYQYFDTGALKRTYGTRTYPTEFTYDPQGRIKTLTTWQEFDTGTGQGISGDATTTWHYSPTRGWLTSKVYHGGGSNGPTYDYWPSGRLKQRTWTAPRGITTNYVYNNAGELAAIDYSDTTPDVSYTFDRRGRLVGVTDGVGTRTIAHNDAGQPLTEDFTSGFLDPVTITSTYDDLLRRERHEFAVSGSQRNQVDFAYEQHSSRLWKVTKDTSYVAEYGYVPGSDLIHTLAFKQGANTLATGTRDHDDINRLESIAWDSASGPDESFVYEHNDANQRTRVTLADGSYWVHGYDSLGQLTSGKRYFNNGTPADPMDDISVPGQQFEYGFDDIGNRTHARAGGDQTGGGLREVTYTPNLLNQYTQRQVSGGVDIMGSAAAGLPVTVTDGTQSPTVYRYLEYFQALLNWVNSTEAIYQQVDIEVDGDPYETRFVFLPKTPEAFTYDADGNLTGDGRWTYTWDAENRLIAMEPRSTGLPTALPKRKLVFTYDYLGRRCRKRVYKPASGAPGPLGAMQDGSSGGLTTLEPQGSPGDPEPGIIWQLEAVYKYVWDGWLLVGELDGTNATVRTCAWGLDLSRTEQGAGGIGGLLWATEGAGGATYHYVHDGNGNITSVRDALGQPAAAYVYGPFGEALTAEGSLAASQPFRFSTKYTDLESGISYYGYRYFNASTGRWLSRDPEEEIDGGNLYSFVRNESASHIDPLGLKRIIVLFDGQNFFGAGGRGSLRTNGFWKAAAIRQLPQADPDDVVWNTEEDGDWFAWVARRIDSLQRDSKRKCSDVYKVVLVGHSNGGDGARKTAKHLNERGWLNERERHTVDLLYLLDPVAKPWWQHDPDRSYRVSRNVNRAISWHQRSDPRVIAGIVRMQGYLIVPGTDLLWNWGTSQIPGTNPHSDILDDFYVREDFRRQLANVQ